MEPVIAEKPPVERLKSQSHIKEFRAPGKVVPKVPMGKFKSRRNGLVTEPGKGVVLDSVSLVDKKGYVSGKKRIQAILAAGMALKQFRAKENWHDTAELNPEGVVPPLGRTWGIDLAELSDLKREQAKRRDRIRERLDRERTALKTQSADPAPGSNAAELAPGEG